METVTHLVKYRARYALIAAFAIGVLGVLVFGPHGAATISFIEHAFMAMAVAALIALFMEIALHQEFAQNVFEASIGYLLPEELRGELRWIYNQPFLCERHVQTMDIVRIDTSRMRVVSTYTRTFKNITANKQTLSPGIGVTEWFDSEHPSKITSVTCKLDSEPMGPNLAAKTFRNGGDISIGKQDDIYVDSGKRVTVSWTFEETLHENGFSYFHFGAATTNVSITVYWPSDLDVEVRFSHRNSDPQLNKTGPNIWQLDGVLLPLQGIRIYWRRKDLFEAWKATVPEERQDTLYK